MLYTPWCCLLSAISTFPGGGGEIAKVIPSTSNPIGIDLDWLGLRLAKIHFIFWSLGSKVRDIVKWENANISAPGPQIKKLRTLSFLQLLKFEKAKYPYFFNLWPRGRDIGLFSLDDGTYSSSSFWKVTLQRKHFPVELRAGSDVFGIIEACRMGAACMQIENQTFIFFAPPLIYTQGRL